MRLRVDQSAASAAATKPAATAAEPLAAAAAAATATPAQRWRAAFKGTVWRCRGARHLSAMRIISASGSICI